MVEEVYKKGYDKLSLNDWKSKSINELTTVTSGGTPSTKITMYWNGNIRWMSSGELNDKKIYDVVGRITQLGFEKSSTKKIPIRSVLIGLAGQGKTRGTVAINYVELTTNQSIAAILPSPFINPEYLYYNLDFRYKELRGLSTGDGGRGGLNLKIIKNLKILFPGMKEQKAIASVLSDMDGVIESLEKVIDKKQKIKQGTMQSLLTGKKRLPGFNEKWETIELGKLAKFHKGKGLPKSQIVSGGKYKCIHYGELFTFYKDNIETVISRTDRNDGFFISRKNDVLMPTSDVTPNGLATASCIQRNDVILGGDILVIRLDEKIIDGTFLSNVIRNSEDQVMQLISGTTVYHIYASDMKRFKFECPPTLREQNEIVAILLNMKAEIELLEEKLEKYEQMKEGMMQQLLTGRIRLV